MSHFYEMIESPIDYQTELNKIRILFELETVNANQKACSFLEHIEKMCFRSMKLSCNFLSVSSYLDNAIGEAKNVREQWLYYCEAVSSLLFQFFEHFKGKIDIAFDEKIAEVLKIIDFDLDRLNLKRTITHHEIMGPISIIIPKDPAVDEALKIITDFDCRRYIIEYAAKRNEGNIKRKEELLILISKHVEEVIKDKLFSHNEKELCSDVGFLLNNLDLRHNKNVNDIRFYNKTLAKREQWLDLLYRYCIFAFSAKEKITIHKQIEDLKRNVENENERGK